MSRSRVSRNRAVRRGLLVCGLSVSSVSFAAVPAPEEVERESAERVLGAVEIVAATRSSGDAEISPRSVSVLSAQALQERPGLSGVQAALETLPGIQFARTGGLGGQIVLRGFNSNQGRSIITVDGDRYRGRGTLEFNMFDPAGVERIEVIRGPASALYGADAMNGVVNIVTRRAALRAQNEDFVLQPRLRSLEYASVNDMWGGRLELEGGGKGLDVLLGVHKRSAGDYDTPLGRARNSRFDSEGLDFNIGFSPSTDSRWELSGRYQEVDTGRAGGLGAAPGEPVLKVSEEPIRENYLRLGYQGRDFGVLADSLDASLYVRRFDTDIWQTNRANPAMTVAAQILVDAPTVWGGRLLAMKGLGEHLLSYGMDFFHEDFEGRTRRITRTNNASGAQTVLPLEKIDRDSKTANLGLFIADEWQASDALVLSGAVRADWVKVSIGSALANESGDQQAAYGRHPGGSEKALTGSLGAVFRLDEVWSVAANLSRGFRAPSGLDMTITSTAGTVTTLPSPDLDPEISRTLELGLRWAAARQRGSLTAYQSNYQDLITTTVVSPTLRQRQNVAKAVIRGLELEGEQLFDRGLSVQYMLTATRGRDRSASRPLPGIAPLSGRLAVRQSGEYGHLEGVVRGYKGRDRIDRTQERKTSSYAMFDVYGRLELQRLMGAGWSGWQMMVGVENLFDRLGRNPTVAEDIAYPRGTVGNPLVEPGRNFVFKLSSDF